MRVTADTITDEQIRELWGDYAITTTEVCAALSTDSRRRYAFESSELYEARRLNHRGARARCAEIWNARSKS